jgi:hypothetical protein
VRNEAHLTRQRRIPKARRTLRNVLHAVAVCAVITASAAAAAVPVQADAPSTTVAPQVMVSTGLAARNPFEAWFVLDKASDPAVPGYAVPAGATVRFTFPQAFTPRPGGSLESVMLTGWAQGSIPVQFTVALDARDPRTVVIHFDQPIVPNPPGSPGLKGIHLRTNEINPAQPGDYPIAVQFIEAGPLSGTTTAIAHITARPVPNIAPYNQLHPGKDEDWQHVAAGTEAMLPVDFLVTLPDTSRSEVTLRAAPDGMLTVLNDGRPIGSISTRGVPVTLTPQAFGPGFSRLGIIEVHVRAGTTRGNAQVVASLDGGTRCVINLAVEGP